MVRRKSGRRRRVGRVSYYPHHGAWSIYYRDADQPVRRRVAETEVAAERVAAQINAQLATASPTPFSFTSIGVAELRRRFLDHHEQVRRSSLATIRRYRAATLHLENFAQETGDAQYGFRGVDCVDGMKRPVAASLQKASVFGSRDREGAVFEIPGTTASENRFRKPLPKTAS